MKHWLAGVFALAMLASCGEPRVSNLRAPQTPPPSQLTVVELFESQGCSSCPPAIANVNALASRGDVLALMYGVTYWDDLGWPDTFAQPAFTERQRAYARAMGARMYTPQVVLNGRTDLVGNRRDEFEAAIARAAASRFSATVRVSGDQATVTALAPETADAEVWLVRYDPMTRNVAIGAGENRGRTIAHVDIVREITRLGDWNGSAQTYVLPRSYGASLRSAVLVQGLNGGPILGAVKIA
jgi:hypothetical protein